MISRYLQTLTERLADGLARLPEAERAPHVAFLLAHQNPDGGFRGRDGASDLYYTAFALRSLAALDALTPTVCERAATFLRQCLAQQTSVVDFFSFLYSCLLVQLCGGPDVLSGSAADWPERVATTLETFRTTDGGYAKATGSASGSTYHTFLVGLCYQMLGRSLPRSAEIAAFLHSRRREDGGFVELAPMKRSGTNPTAAAIGVLQLLDSDGGAFLTDDIRRGVVDLLAGLPSEEGGLRANGRIPAADLLSTFTGLWTLAQLNGLDRIDTTAALQYAQSLKASDGGFRGNAWDECTDVEYTFYGLGVVALLSPPTA
jgi:geranylgeranyl transferase type-2 subunit beta